MSIRCEQIPRRRFFSDAPPGDSTQTVEEIWMMSQGFQMRKWCFCLRWFLLYMFLLSHGKLDQVCKQSWTIKRSGPWRSCHPERPETKSRRKIWALFLGEGGIRRVPLDSLEQILCIYINVLRILGQPARPKKSGTWETYQILEILP